MSADDPKFETREEVEAWLKFTTARRDEWRRSGSSILSAKLTRRINDVRAVHDHLLGDHIGDER